MSRIPDHTTSADEVSALIDDLDSARRRYADAVLEACEATPSRDQPLKPANEQLRAELDALRSNERAIQLALHPNLARHDFLRMMELVPEASARNPLLPLLLVDGSQIIREDFELIALGELAKSCLSGQPGTAAHEFLADIICAGLPPTEAFGGNMGETDPRFGASEANRYCWRDARLWSLRAIALHRAGNAVIDALRSGGATRARQALDACDRVGYALTDYSDRWRDWHTEVKVATPGSLVFDVTLMTLARDDSARSCREVIGWREGTGERIWLDRPGFMNGVKIKREQVPNHLRRLVLDGWTMKVTNEEGGFGMDLAEVDGTMAIRAINYDEDGTSHTAIIPDLPVSRPFPEHETRRLAKLFGEDSLPVWLARNPASTWCPGCEDWTLELLDDGGDEHHECESCGFSRTSDDEDED